MKSLPPLTVEVTRGDRVESVHLVDCVIADTKAGIVAWYGETDHPVFPRSSVKAFQATLLVESGAADKFGFNDKHLALACSSHNAEQFQIDAVREMLSRCGIDEACLECGAEMPRLQQDQLQLGEGRGVPQRIHNNCSGKHAGFLAVCSCMEFPEAGYINIAHPLQRTLAGVMEQIIGHPHTNENHAIDGCSIPTYAVPMARVAAAFAGFGTGVGVGRERQKAFDRLRLACARHPEMVAGTGRVCTQIMQTLGERAFVKVGAEGVYTASLPEPGLGIAMKARDGNPRAAEVAVANMIGKFLTLSDQEEDDLKHVFKPTVMDRNGNPVGELRIGN